jgi:hypothetical protein
VDVFGYRAVSWGNDTITDFADGVDRISFAGLGLTFANLSVTNGTSGAVVSYSDNGVTSTITLTGVAAASLDTNDFLF